MNMVNAMLEAGAASNYPLFRFQYEKIGALYYGHIAYTHSGKSRPVPPVYGRYFRLRVDAVNGSYVDLYDFQLYGRTPADMTALRTVISTCNTFSEAAYTANSWAPFKAKLDAAKAMVAQMTATQDVVNAAAADLQAAVGTLVPRGDTTLLNGLVTICNSLSESAYTPSSWALFAPQLTAAKATLIDPNAVQSDVDAAYLALITAKLALQERAQTGVLVQTNDASAAQDTTHNTPATVAALHSALDAAKLVRDNLNATQAQVNEAATRLLTAMVNLLDIVDNKKLVDLAAAADQIDLSKYTQDTAAALRTVLAQAKQVFANQDATKEQIDNAYRDLANAMANLKAVVNKGELSNVIALADSILNAIDSYTPSSVKNLKQAADAAKAVFAKADATQDEVNQAAKDLAAVVQQARAKADKSQLTQTATQANAIDGSRYTAESVQLMKAALHTANLLLADEDAEQADVDNAKAQLSKAMDGLKLLSAESTSSTPTTTETKQVNTGDSQPFVPFAMTLAGALILMALKKGKKRDE